MKTFLILSGSMTVIFMLMHEFDACYEGEWKMFKFLRVFKEQTQYLIFLYIHIPLCIGAFYYLWCVFQMINLPIWIVVNAISVVHFSVHFFAKRWKSNVFTSFSSFLFITGAAVTGIVNLLLCGFYR
jgi:hypothetical protein